MMRAPLIWRIFLPSLEAALNFLDRADYQVYAFDNSSADSQTNQLSLQSFNEISARRPIKILTQGCNLGFSRAYNILINSALKDQAEYFLVINPDTFIEPEAIKKLIATLDRDLSLASVSPKICRWNFVAREKTSVIDSLGIILKPGLQFLDLGQGADDHGQFDQTKILGPSGAAGLFRLSALKKISEPGINSNPQYFDERFFMYKEDCDLVYRLFLAGYKSVLVPEALIYHDRTAASSGQGLLKTIQGRQRKSRQVRSWSFRNQHLIFVKHWKSQNLTDRIFISFWVLFMFIFSLILEQFLLKEYYLVFSSRKALTNIK